MELSLILLNVCEPGFIILAFAFAFLKCTFDFTDMVPGSALNFHIFVSIYLIESLLHEINSPCPSFLFIRMVDNTLMARQSDEIESTSRVITYIAALNANIVQSSLLSVN